MKLKTLPQKTIKNLFEYLPYGHLVWKQRVSPTAGAGDFAGYFDTSRGYWKVGIAGKTHLLHRIIYAYHTGIWPRIVDHKDRDTSHNRIENLRSATFKESAINRSTTIQR